MRIREFLLMRSFSRTLAALAVFISWIAMIGCGGSSNPPEANEPKPTPKTLRLAIVDDPALAAAAERLRGEWHAQSESELKVQTISTADALAADRIDADAIVYPTALLGSLAERRLIRPFNKSWLADAPLDSSDLLQSLDAPEFNWDAQPIAVPMGSPVFVLLYRPDLFEKFAKQPPKTWDDYQSLAKFFNDRASLPLPRVSDSLRRGEGRSEGAAFPKDWHGTVEPLAEGWAVKLLIARAAPYARHRDYFSILFDRETMAPLIAGPPFVRALEELVATLKFEPAEALSMNPIESAQSLRNGRSAMAIGWPAAPHEDQAKLSPFAFVELPGSAQAYNLGGKSWEPRREDENIHVPTHAISGRVGSVVRGSDNAEQAFKLLEWLSSKRWSSQWLPESSATTMFRRSQLADPAPWLGDLPQSSAKQYTDALSTSLASKNAIVPPRIPGQAEYMAALDEAVHEAASSKISPKKALEEAAKKWTEITERLGAKQQLEAYRKSLSLQQ
jgi:ABC-type glycerol-3-phosphate transport system substrate-binding protein